MNGKSTDTRSRKPGGSREERLKVALKANIARRKSQARARLAANERARERDG